MLKCHSCGSEFPQYSPIWRCPCGGVLDVRGASIFPRDQLARRPMNFWRYRESLALPEDEPRISLGETITSLLRVRFRDWDVSMKLDHTLPTGSYKDRGVAVCLNHLYKMGFQIVSEDSSGNAGASTAAYAAAAGMHANIFVPETTSPAKINQIKIYGAECHLVSGTRTEAAKEAQIERQATQYIGHSWNPFFACGIKSIAYEIAEQCDWCPPDWIVTPVGGGSLVMGLIDGFGDLLDAGYIQNIPKIVAVQSAACAPIYQAWSRHEPKVTSVELQQTYAEGVALPNPPRGTQVLEAIRRTDNVMLSVDDADLISCWRDMARIGIFMEPTSALTVAGAYLARTGREIIAEKDKTVIIVTGHGLKTKSTLVNVT
ncbi:hypothetical protein BFN67_12620 [Pseudaminobacter manganicus]|uniref:Tryptophan synthase beta chain-like PALP domain-containing protein n=1 Tax=Manganibacter manganicus TaxID=1873176 RepID=A0A1V8RUE0_9HYPH|nr:hypothetical protein BFN67_12620 [Pseudaminobacter manganicus]